MDHNSNCDGGSGERLGVFEAGLDGHIKNLVVVIDKRKAKEKTLNAENNQWFDQIKSKDG